MDAQTKDRLTLGHLSSQGIPAMTSTASAPPTPMHRPPSPPAAHTTNSSSNLSHQIYCVTLTTPPPAPHFFLCLSPVPPAKQFINYQITTNSIGKLECPVYINIHVLLQMYFSRPRNVLAQTKWKYTHLHWVYGCLFQSAAHQGRRSSPG